MTYSSCLSDDLSPLILDTSVLINLHASTHGGRILHALPNDILVPEIVMAELEHETSRANGEHQFIQDLVTTGKVQLAVLSESECEVYATLVSGITSLGDGEAATIAIASCRRHQPVIDERKGRLQASTHCPGYQPGWSLDLFRHSQVVKALGSTESVHTLYLALRDGRMRIHEDHCDHVVGLIGIERALECNSLPGYKARKAEWQTSGLTK